MHERIQSAESKINDRKRVLALDTAERRMKGKRSQYFECSEFELNGGLEGLRVGLVLRNSKVSDWNRHENSSPTAIRFNVDVPFELAQPLPHSPNTDTGYSRLNLR
jgi:hypothetical protein